MNEDSIRVGRACDGCSNVLEIDWLTRTCPHKGTTECQQRKRELCRGNYAAQMNSLGYDAGGNPLPEIPEKPLRAETPEAMPAPAVYYERTDSKYPDVIRLSFSDGHTEIYDRRVTQPSPKRYLNMPRHMRKGQK